MRILIAGSSGLIGSDLTAFLSAGGNEVYHLVRNKSRLKPNEITWDPSQAEIDLQALEGFDAVINLCGESIAEGRWNDNKKQRILESRIAATKLLVDSFAKLKIRPMVFINASAIGFYGDRKDAVMVEESAPGSGFLADVCQKWEAEAAKAEGLGIRVVELRIGAVLSNKGGALPKMVLPFKLCVGGKIGSGRQWMSWIALDDLLSVILHCLMTDEIKGPLNAVSPDAVTNTEFTKVLAKVLNRPAFLPVPKIAIRLALGQMADELLLASTCVEPKKLKSTNFKFAYPHLEEALRHLLK